MARQCFTRDFFWQMSNVLLARAFKFKERFEGTR